jgi:hypothetical protein
MPDAAAADLADLDLFAGVSAQDVRDDGASWRPAALAGGLEELPTGGCEDYS